LVQRFRGPDDGFRLTGRAVARYDLTPDRVQVVLGALYINRYHTKLIPAAGVVWKPNDDLNLEMVFPQAKLARRLRCGPGYENWVYLSGGFAQQLVDRGRGRRAGRADPERLARHAGWEQQRDGGAGFRVEVGYVFSREMRIRLAAASLYPRHLLVERSDVLTRAFECQSGGCARRSESRGGGWPPPTFGLVAARVRDPARRAASVAQRPYVESVRRAQPWPRWLFTPAIS